MALDFTRYFFDLFRDLRQRRNTSADRRGHMGPAALRRAVADLAWRETGHRFSPRDKNIRETLKLAGPLSKASVSKTKELHQAEYDEKRANRAEKERNRQGAGASFGSYIPTDTPPFRQSIEEFRQSGRGSTVPTDRDATYIADKYHAYARGEEDQRSKQFTWMQERAKNAELLPSHRRHLDRITDAEFQQHLIVSAAAAHGARMDFDPTTGQMFPTPRMDPEEREKRKEVFRRQQAGEPTMPKETRERVRWFAERGISVPRDELDPRRPLNFDAAVHKLATREREERESIRKAREAGAPGSSQRAAEEDRKFTRRLIEMELRFRFDKAAPMKGLASMLSAAYGVFSEIPDDIKNAIKGRVQAAFAKGGAAAATEEAYNAMGEALVDIGTDEAMRAAQKLKSMLDRKKAE